ncbi:MAG: efflux RND transporter periplasmic adaptor subunit [Hyphomonadaceae bacterium JAD_PAG50586_4]|nr:MAG: efflux RND transporter periplasmic adaptor subunit [Hyphomonadaceae bacterium JAD_PAG50586_4]
MADGGAKNQMLDDFLGKPRSTWIAANTKWIALGAAFLVLAFALSRCVSGPPGASFLTEQVRRGDIEVVVTATGNLTPTNQIDIGSELSGIVEHVLVDVNDAVTAGQALAMIDTDRFNDAVSRSSASLEASTASVAQARATLEEAQAQLERLREVSRLSGGRVPSQSEMAGQEASVARAEAALRLAQANVRSARAQLSSDRTQLGKAVIRSPVSGVVLGRSIDPGQTVQAAFSAPSLFIIAEDLRHMRLEVSIDEADVGLVREGLEATFTVDAFPGRSFPAVISRVSLGASNVSGGSSSTSASESSNVVSYLAILELDNLGIVLRPGMTATASIRAETTRNVLMVPNAALRFTPPRAQAREARRFTIRPPDARQAEPEQERGIGVGSRQTVYVLENDRSLRGIAVVTGQSDGRYTAITAEGLTPGMPVVTGVRAGAADG